MIVRASHEYAQDLATVFTAFTDPEFYKMKFKGIGARNVKVVSHKKKGTSFTIQTEREMPLDVPGVLKSFLGEWNKVLQREEWEDADGEYVNELELNSEGVPVSIRGSMVLRPDGSGCVNEVEMEIRCDIPFVGKKLEEFVGRNTERGLADEYEVITAYLSKPPKKAEKASKDTGKAKKKAKAKKK